MPVVVGLERGGTQAKSVKLNYIYNITNNLIRYERMYNCCVGQVTRGILHSS